MEDGIVTRPHQQSTVAVLVIVSVITIFMNVVFRRRRADANHNRALIFKDTVRGSLSILSNENSVLDREGVKGSIEGYERLFDGARQSVGSISSKESVALREKEYRTMVNSFYDLVTDFYEWGWGQVGLIERWDNPFPLHLMAKPHYFFLFIMSVFPFCTTSQG